MLTIMISLIVLLLVMLWIVNSLFLSYIYRGKKIRDMQDIFNSLDKVALSGELYDGNYRKTFEQISFNNNLDIAVVSYDGTVLLASGREDTNTVHRLFDALLSEKDSEDRMVHTDNYDIVLDKDAYLGDEYLILSGTLSDSNIIMIRYAMANMELSIAIFDRTLIIVAVIVFVVAFVLVEIFTRRLVHPVMELTDISKKMTELDFNVKYEPRERMTEIDVLGEHMNTMSRTLEETYAELQQANDELKKDIKLKEKHEEMQTEFLSNVAHELKTPIALISGYAEGLIDGMADDPENRQYYLDVIVDESAKMTKLVGQLMSLNELQYSDRNEEPEEFSVTELIRGIVDLSKILINQYNIRVEYDIKEDIVIKSVPSLIETAFSNYLTNAIHYCKGDKVIRISQTDEGESVRISVYNSGDNIPDEAIPRLWDKFYKVDKARTREYGGSGVGLSMVKLSIESLGGRYGVYNSDFGVTFWFEIHK